MKKVSITLLAIALCACGDASGAEAEFGTLLACDVVEEWRSYDNTQEWFTRATQ